jgi:hypothetical protein
MAGCLVMLAGCVPDYGPGYGYPPGYGYRPGYGYAPGYGQAYAQSGYQQPRYAQPYYAPPPAYAPAYRPPPQQAPYPGYGFNPGSRTVWTGPNQGFIPGPPPPQGTPARESWQRNQGTEVSGGN